MVVGEVGLLAPLLSVCLVDLPLRRRRKDSLNDFLKDLRREIGASPAPDRSGITTRKLTSSFGNISIQHLFSYFKEQKFRVKSLIT